MALSFLKRWLQPVSRTAPGRRRRFARPRLEALEDRTLLFTFTVNTLADTGAGSLRQAIIDANSPSFPGDDIINITATGIIQLSSPLPALNTNIAIHGPGADLLTVRRNVATAFGIFTVNVGTMVSIFGLTMSNGSGAVLGGGGVRSSGTLTITNSTISGNFAVNFGGGISNSNGTLTVTNSTISANFAGSGGGISNSGTLTVTNSTISGNSAGGSGGGIEDSGTASIRNTIIAGNTAPTGPDVNGAVGSLGNNLIGNTSGGSGFVASDLQNVNALLGPLQDNGGPTFTHALLPGSPAIDAGANAGAAGVLDQRGFTRFVNGVTDIGAFEVQQYLVTTTADSGAGSLRTALTNANLAGGSTIVFATAGIINLASALPSISRDVDIRGPGANVLTVRRNVSTAFRIFTVNSGNAASISGLTISNGNPGGIAPNGLPGGGILNSGSLTLINSTVTGNLTATPFGQGGGVFSSGTLTISNSSISANVAVGLGGGVANTGTMTLTNSTVSGNISAQGGGGIVNPSAATLTITNSTISGNSASGTNAGGGIATSGTISIRNTIIAGNTAGTGPDVSGAVTSLGNNLIGNPTGGSGFVASDLLSFNPLLGPLRNNGGPTPTHALLSGSPAIDAGNNMGAPLFDQRGATFPRNVNGTVDIGAVEYQNAPAISSIPRTAFTILVGQTLTLSNIAFTGRQVAHVASVDWGDSSLPSSVFLAAGDQFFSASHAYPVGGSFPITVTVTADDQSGSDSVRLNAAVGTPTPPANLVSWWSGDGNPTLTAPDIAGSNPGTLSNGARYVPGLVGQAFDFNGTGARVEVANAASLNDTTATWSFWMRTTQSGSPIGLMGKHDPGSLNGVTVSMATSGQVFALVGSGTAVVPLVGTTLVNNGQFHHVALTFQSGGTSVLYIDGRAEATITAPAFTMSSNPLRLGRVTNTNVGPYLGVLDEVQIHSRVLSAAEIQQMASAGSLGLVKGVFVGANTLQVQTLTPTNTGFSALFNRAIDPSVLNLYDTQSGGLGAADVTLAGATSGPIRGSLVLNGTNTGFTFIRTGGVLPANDTYTVTLRSATNGFKDTLGNLLDGDGNGTSGDNFTGTFLVPASTAISVIIPDFTRGPNQAVNIPANTSNGIPLRLSNPVGVDSVDLTLRYDPALLTITSAVRGPLTPSDAQVTINTTTPGVAIISFSSATPLTSTANEFVLLTANVPAGAANRYTGKQVLDLSNVLVNDVAARDDDGIHINAYLGDTNANGSYSALDAQRTARVVVGLDGGFAFYPLGDPTVVADITGNSALTSADATRILQKDVGLEPGASLIPLIPAGITIPQPPGPDPLLRFSKRLRGRPGQTITAPLLLDPADGLQSADLAIAYDAQRLEVVEVRRGSLTRDFDLFLHNLDASTGTLRVGLAQTVGANVSGRGSVLEIVFRIRSDAPAGRATINLRRDLGALTTQLNEGGLDLIPDPSNEAGDALDGAITVVAPRKAGNASRTVPVIDAVFAELARKNARRRSI